MLPFTREQFLAVFERYDAVAWPAAVVACLLAIGIVAAVLRPSDGRDRFAAVALAAMWIWTGVVYHALFFADINKAALGFAALFVVQGLLFVAWGASSRRLRLGSPGGWRGRIGWLLVEYATLIYPMLAIALGHNLAALPLFGITPCPLTLFTFGILLLTRDRVAWWLLVIPVAWSLVGGSAAFLLGIAPDWPLLLTGLVVWLLTRRPRAAA